MYFRGMIAGTSIRRSQASENASEAAKAVRIPMPINTSKERRFALAKKKAYGEMRGREYSSWPLFEFQFVRTRQIEVAE